MLSEEQSQPNMTFGLNALVWSRRTVPEDSPGLVLGVAIPEKRCLFDHYFMHTCLYLNLLKI